MPEQNGTASVERLATEPVISIAEFQQRYADDAPAAVTWGQLRAYRKAAWQLAEVLDVNPPGTSVGQSMDIAIEATQKLVRLAYEVDHYLNGRRTADELKAALDQSGVMA